MQPRDLNLTAHLTGHQRYLFLHGPQDLPGLELARRIDDLSYIWKDEYA